MLGDNKQRERDLERAAVRELIAAARLESTQAIKAMRDSVDVALCSAEKAVTKAESATDKRISTFEDSVTARFLMFNEIRQTANDAAARGISRTEVDAKIDAMNERVSTIGSRMDKRDGSGAGMNQIWLIIVAGFSMLVGLSGIAMAVLKK